MKGVALVLFSLLCLTSFVCSQQQQVLNLGNSTDVLFLTKENYFYFTLPTLAEPLMANQSLVFVVSPLSAGDVDIYVSTHTPTPKAQDYDFKSVGQAGIDAVIINATYYTHTTYYVGVRAYHADTTFTLIAYLSDKHIFIKDGVPQISSVQQGQYTYFAYYVSTTGWFTISNTAITGNPDIYVSTLTTKPSITSYEYKVSLTGSDILNIYHSGSPKYYYIGIYGATYAIFNLDTTHADTRTHLADAMPLRQVVTGYGIQYYKYNLTIESPLTITATKRSTWGDPDIYVSTTTETPNPNNFIWRAWASGSDSITIQPGSAGYRLGYFYIGVRDDSTFSVTFDLLVKTQMSHTVLTAGRPQNAESEQGKYDYYKFFYSGTLIDGSLDLVASASNGRVTILASRTSQYPSLTDKEFVGAIVGSASSIHINPVTDGWYYIAVYSNEASNYTITAASSDDPVYLVNGRPVNFYVARAHFKPFVFDVNDTVDVTISLQVSSGDADLYVGIKERTYIWYSILAYGTDVITIAKDDPWRYVPDFKGRFYIYVHGYVNSYFTLTAHVGNSTIELLNGVPIAGNVKFEDYAYYSYYMTQVGRLSFNLQVTPGGNNNADLYISRRTSRPNAALYEYKSTGMGSDFVSIDATPGYYWIGVYGASSPNASYTLSATADYEALATNGLSIVDSVPKGTYRYYTTTVSWSSMVSTLVSTGVTLISGATKLYMLNNGSFPSSTSYRRRDESWPGNMINVDTARDVSVVENATTTWTYAVYGVDDSLYYIHSSLNSPYQGILRPGEPKIGYVNGSHISYFRFANGVNTNKNYYLNVALLSYLPYSSLSIFIDQAENLPTEQSNKWNITTAYDTLVPITKDKFTTPNPLIVGVKMHSTAPAWWMNQMRFIFTLASEDDPVFLTQEQPHEVQAEVGKAYSFAVYIPRDATGLTIFVRSCTNAVPPRIYVSRANKHPNITSYDYKSDLQGKYSQALFAATGVSGIVPNVLYYIGTDMMTENTVFTIYAFTKEDLRPRPGAQGRLDVFGTVAVGQVQVAIPALEFAHQPAQYLVYKRVLQGAETPDNINMETVCAVTKSSSLVNRVDVPPNMPPTLYTTVPVSYKEKCIVNIIAEDTYRLKGIYNPLYFVTNEFNELGRGLPMRGLVNDSTMVYFVIPKFDYIDLTRTDIRLTISVTPLVGDVDIYVSNTGRPTKEEYLWKGNQGGFDILKIPRNDPKWNYGPYVVGVIAAGGSKVSQFSIMSFIEPLDSIVLYDGQPQVAESVYMQFTYFNFTLDDNSTLSISGTPLYGDVDLVVSTVTPRPNRQNREWAASLGGLDVLTIENTDPKYKPFTTYYIGAYGWTNTQYAITATKKFSIALLNEGVPLGASLKAETYAYFRFEVIDDRGLTITVTPTTSDGDPDIFVSTIHSRPSLYRSEWSSQRSGADTIVIEKTDPNWRKTTYYIAVRAYHTDCNFQIMAVSSEGASLVAVDGVPQNVYARQGSYTYFRFYHGYQDNRISFTTTPRSLGAGPIDIYMSRTFAKPDSIKFERKSQLQGAISVLNIASGSPVGWYYLGIVTPAANVNYTFTASTNQVPLLLVDGQIRIDNYVPAGYTKYFVFQLTTPMLAQDLVIALSAAFGDPDMYVSWNSTRPSPTNYQWKSDRAGGDSISIHPGEMPAFVRRLNIAVFAYTSTRFSIVGFSANQTMVLQDATGVPGRISTYRYNQYVYEMRNAGRLKFNLELTSPFPADADLYVSRTPYPSAANYEWKSTKFGVDFVIIENAAPGRYYIAVQGVSGNIAASYVLTASSEYEYLTDGQALIEFVNRGQSRVFKSYISEYAHHVLTAVTLINGRTELYGCVNCTGNITRDNAHFVATGWPGNAIYVARTDSKFHGGEWTFVVNAIENSDFFISIQTREGRLQSGQPRRGATVPGTPIYYMFALDIGASSKQDYYLNIKTFHSSNCVRVFASQQFERPNRTHTTWYGVSDPKQESHSIMWLPANEIDWTEPALYIGVEACPALVPRQSSSPFLVDYEIVISSVNDPLYITQDFADVYPLQQAKHFAMLSSMHAAALHIELMSCTRQVVKNAIQLFATSNQSIPYPDATNAEFTASAVNDYTLLITSDKVKANSKYWISMLTSTIPATFVYSIFSTTRSRDPRPVAGGGFGSRDNNLLKLDKANVQQAENNMINVQFSLSFVPAKPASIMSNDRTNKLVYDVVALNLDQDLDPKDRGDTPQNKLKKTNYQTPCSIRFNTNTRYIANYTSSIAVPPPSVIVLNPTFTVPADSSNVWVINVIVRDEATGLEATYVPILFPVSLFDDSYQWFSIGATLILIFVGFFLAYLFIGSMVNVIKYKQRGIAALPNIDFWRDLPVLVYEGFMYTVCCCRVQKQYAAFVDEPTDVPHDVVVSNTVNNNDDEQGYPVDAQDRVTDEDEVHDNPFQQNQQPDKAGYGAI